LSEEILLDEESSRILNRVEQKISGETVSFSETGRWNELSLIDTALGLSDSTRNTQNRGDCGECLKRLFYCPCCCAAPLTVKQSFSFDSRFRALLQECQIDLEELEISPVGGLSVIDYLHYGTCANAAKVKLFDTFLPSLNLNHTLQNGQ
jgi:hypothetical protein